jgi:hypothetical protein
MRSQHYTADLFKGFLVVAVVCNGDQCMADQLQSRFRNTRMLKLTTLRLKSIEQQYRRHV